MILAGLISAWILGGVIVVAFFLPRRSSGESLLFVSLAAVVGLGATSVIFFLASLVSTRPAIVSGAAELGLMVVFGWWAVRKNANRPRAESLATAPPRTWLEWAMATVFIQAAVVAAIVAWRAYRAEPYGGWDGWAIWNLHARFMIRGGSEWRALLHLPELSWTHPDYPWLVPASVARLWAWAGNESAAAAALLSSVFGLALLGLLIGIVRRLRERMPALLAGILLLGTPFFVTFASNEHADIPLASFMLAAVGLIALPANGPDDRGRWALAGICAGLAAWTKNEGLLFALGFGVVCCVHAWRRGSRSDAVALLGGLAVGLAPVVAFKLFLAPPNDLVSAPWGPRIAQIFDLGRHRIILARFGQDLLHFGEWQPLPFLAMALPFLAWKSRRPLADGEKIIPIVIVLMLAGFYAVYLLTPQDLAWHLETSLVRLLLQLWPLALLAWCLALPKETLTSATTPKPWFTALVFFLANTVVAAGVCVALSRQPASNELALLRRGRTELSAVVADGWFGVEHEAATRWAWSRGRATLQLRASATTMSRDVMLRFTLRSLAPRQVSIAYDGRVLWHGEVRDQFVPVVLPALTLHGDATTLEFTTDAPGTNEFPSGGGRALAFAVYDVQVE